MKTKLFVLFVLLAIGSSVSGQAQLTQTTLSAAVTGASGTNYSGIVGPIQTQIYLTTSVSGVTGLNANGGVTSFCVWTVN